MENDRTAKLKIGGKEYTLILTLKATKAISERFGGLTKMGEALTKATADNLGSVIWLIATLANQSVLIYNFEHPESPEKEVTEELIELMMKPIDLAEAKEAIMECMIKGTKRDVESDAEKN